MAAKRADLVAGHADGAGVIGQGRRDALANPPGRIGAELEAQPVLVLVHRPHQAAIAFLDEVGERQAAAAIALGNRHDQTQVALGQLAAGLLILNAAMLQNAHQLDEIARGRAHFESEIAQLFGRLGPAFAVGRRTMASVFFAI